VFFTSLPVLALGVFDQDVSARFCLRVIFQFTLAVFDMLKSFAFARYNMNHALVTNFTWFLFVICPPIGGIIGHFLSITLLM
jgi:hypothetical protein